MASRHGHDARVTVDDRNVAETRSRIAGRIVARQRELELILAAVAAGRDILLEGSLATPKAPCCEPSLSGSMRGGRAQTAAAAAGAPVAELASDDFGVVAFWSDALVLADLGQHRSITGPVDAHLRIPARGLTNLSFPLRVADRQLRRIPTHDTRALLLSDCVHNAGPDPRGVAARLPRLDVLLDTSGEHDADLARDRAPLGRGHLAPINGYQQVAPALSEAFSR